MSNEIWKGSFDCCHIDVRSLEGSPAIVTDSFYCYSNPKLKSLEGAPKSVGGAFIADIYEGENRYIMANAMLNGRKDHEPTFEEEALEVLTEIFY